MVFFFIWLTSLSMTVSSSVHVVVVVQSPSHVWLFVTPWTAAHQASPAPQHLPKFAQFMSITSVKTSSHLILWHPLLLLPSVFPSIRGLFQWVGCSHQMTKLLELQIQHQSFQQVLRLISLKIDWSDLFAIQGTLRSLFQHHSSKSFIFPCSTFFMV